MYIRPIEKNSTTLQKRSGLPTITHLVTVKEADDAIIVDSIESDLNRDRPQKEASENNYESKDEKEQQSAPTSVNVTA